MRQLGTELEADPRVVALAYRDLAADGLVAVRARAGVFVTELPASGANLRDPPAAWLSDVIADGVLRGVPAPALPGWLTAAVAARPLSAVVVADILDQVQGLARELHEDYGVAARGVLLDEITRGERLPRALTRAHFILTTPASAERVRRLAERLGKPHIVASVRPDLLSLEWRSLLRRTVYVLVADPRFTRVVREFVSHAEGAPNVRVLVVGKDDVGAIPVDAPTYVTESARERLGRTRLPGRLLAPMRTLSDECVREVTRLIVRLNLAETTPRGASRHR